MRVAHVCNPALDDGAPTLRAIRNQVMSGCAAAEVEHFVIQPSTSAVRAGVRTVALPVAGRAGSSMVRYRGLLSALADAELVRLHGDPGTALALQVARISRRPGGPPLVIEVEHMAGHPSSFIWRLVARRVLAQADAVIVRHGHGLAQLRRLGFKGISFIAGAGAVSPRAAAVLRSGPLTLALAPVPLTVQSGAIDVLEAVAVHPGTILLAAPLAGHQRLADRAAALDMIDRLRFVPAADLLAEANVLVAVPHPRAGTRFPYDRMIEQAQSAGIPVICSDVDGLAEVTGAGGWIVPAYDTGAIFEVLRTGLGHELLAAAGSRAAAHVASRQAESLDGPGMRRVMAAAQSRPGSARLRSGSGANPAVQP